MPAVGHSRLDDRRDREGSHCLLELASQNPLLPQGSDELRILIVDQLIKHRLGTLQIHRRVSVQVAILGQQEVAAELGFVAESVRVTLELE